MAAMTSPTDATIAPGNLLETADQRVVMYGRTWADYEAQLELQGERSRPKLAYLDGAIELMSPSRDRERIKSRLGRVIDAYLIHRKIFGAPYGEWTLRDRSKEAGGQPDECFIFSADPESKPRPDLVIEVNWSSGGINKLEIYRRLQVAEVWFWEDDAIQVYVLGDDGYTRHARSSFLPELDLAFVCTLLELGTINEIYAAVAAMVAEG